MSIKRLGSLNEKSNSKFPIVGIGASAGGLETFSQLLSKIPSQTGMAFVLIQHLDPSHPSRLSEALGKITKMRVQEIKNGQVIKVNHVYVIPPESDLAVLNGKFTLFSRARDAIRPRMAIDFFFRSLAAEYGRHAIGVILSGNATDGTEGLRAIKAENGVTLAQDPKSAKFDGMPSSAVNADVVDFCLPVKDLAQELTRLAHHPYLIERANDPFTSAKDIQHLQKIFVLLRTAFGVNYSEYKPPTVKRRLARRMAVAKLSSLSDYVKLLEEDPPELKALAADILIHVTSFFRDPEVFKKIKTTAFPGMIKNKETGASLRIWVAGCSTGEEVYSIAISLMEFLGEKASSFHIQVFGSDVSEAVIEKARLGFYTENMVRDIGKERLQRFFVKTHGGYRICNLIRDLCVFVKHDMGRDPPLSKLDLILCRNVLIYFENSLQKRVISTFHYCLNQPGFLLLGRTESISTHSHLFSSVDKSNKIYLRENVVSPLRFSGSVTMHSKPGNGGLPSLVQGLGLPHFDIGKQFDQFLLTRFTPAGVAINENMEVLQFRGQTGFYLEQPSGQPQLNFLKMLREGLFSPIKIALAESKKKTVVVRRDNVEFNYDGKRKFCNIIVAPILKVSEPQGAYYLVLFEEVKPKNSSLLPSIKSAGGAKTREKSARLEHELRSTREYLQTVSEEHQKANDTLNSVNEELVSGNEELQSMNEELETAKEELQSTNEELTTVNDELQNRNQETGQINDDLVNLLNSVEIPILILDLSRHIRRFTPRASLLMNLLPTDIGRPLSDIKSNFVVEDLDKKIQEVIKSSKIADSEVQDLKGKWFRLQIRPYKGRDDKTLGVVISFMDIDALRGLLTQAQHEKSVSDKANETKNLFLATLSHELRTPLTALILQAGLLSKGVVSPNKIKHAGDLIQKSAMRQAQLIEDLLDVSRIVSGKLSIRIESINLRNVLQDSIDLVSNIADAKSIILETSMGQFRKAILGDPVRLTQVFSNLLTNAIKFTPAGGQILISLELEGEFAAIKVKDNGIGIEPEFLPHVFKRFTQQDDSSTRAQGGLGLGLAIVGHLVGLHQGHVRAESLGRDQGATFTVLIPLNPSEIGMPHVLPIRNYKTGNLDVNLKGFKLLIVEDDQGCREALSEILIAAGADVRGAASGAEAREIVKKFVPTALICDIAMPNENGYTLLRRLRSLSSFKKKKIPAIALTALASDLDRQKARLAGFQIHIAKPFDIEDLTDALVGLHKPRKVKRQGV